MSEESGKSVWSQKPVRKPDIVFDRTKIITPEIAQNKMGDLIAEVDNGHQFLEQSEYEYQEAKTDFELGMAHSRLNPEDSEGMKLTERAREDLALLANQDKLHRLRFAEAMVKSARANTNRIETIAELTRSIGTNVRSSLDTSRG